MRVVGISNNNFLTTEDIEDAFLAYQCMNYVKFIKNIMEVKDMPMF